MTKDIVTKFLSAARKLTVPMALIGAMGLTACAPKTSNWMYDETYSMPKQTQAQMDADQYYRGRPTAGPTVGRGYGNGSGAGGVARDGFFNFPKSEYSTNGRVSTWQVQNSGGQIVRMERVGNNLYRNVDTRELMICGTGKVKLGFFQIDCSSAVVDPQTGAVKPIQGTNMRLQSGDLGYSN